MPKVLVTPRSVTRGGHPALGALTAAGYEVQFCSPGRLPSQEELLQLLPGSVGYLAGIEPITAALLESAPDLKVISRNGAGVDNIDLEAAKRLHIVVRRAEGANARGVAELTLGLILALVRSLPRCDRAIKTGGWERHKGIELKDRTLGIIGCGRIGREVAFFALALGMEVVAYDVAPDPAFHPSPRFRYDALDAVIEQAHIVSLHCPAPQDRTPVITAEAIGRMRKNVFIVNTARAGLIDRAALKAHLDDGHVAGAAIDIFEKEPPGDDPIARHPRVIATPHIGGYTLESVDRAVETAVRNLLDTLEGIRT
jgi:D-3-phosphoglycerate dehydrogenase / 2-oxoglutarate reductase